MITKNRFFRVFSKEAIFYLCTHFYFSLPTEKFCVGREKNIPGQGSDFSIVIKWDF